MQVMKYTPDHPEWESIPSIPRTEQMEHFCERYGADVVAKLRLSADVSVDILGTAMPYSPILLASSALGEIFCYPFVEAEFETIAELVKNRRRAAEVAASPLESIGLGGYIKSQRGALHMAIRS